MGNAATGFFVVFSMIAGVVGVAACMAGLNHLRYWDVDSLPAAASAAAIAWSLTALAMGYVCCITLLFISSSICSNFALFLVQLCLERD